MTEVHDVLGIGPQTRHFALVGQQLSGSPSPAMHRSGYLECGIDARYLPIEAESFETLAALVGPGRLFDVEGFGVTMPFKEQAALRC